MKSYFSTTWYCVSIVTLLKKKKKTSQASVALAPTTFGFEPTRLVFFFFGRRSPHGWWSHTLGGKSHCTPTLAGNSQFYFAPKPKPSSLNSNRTSHFLKSNGYKYPLTYPTHFSNFISKLKKKIGLSTSLSLSLTRTDIK